MSDRFIVSKSTAHNICRRACYALSHHLAPDYIKWPTAAEKRDRSEDFEDYCIFSGTVGAHDDTHIPIKAPTENSQAYVNRKAFHSVVLQGVCDMNLLFHHAYTGWPGSTHDARVLRNSQLFKESDHMFSPGEFLLGDGAYTLQP